jgi:hypothetical protein
MAKMQKIKKLVAVTGKYMKDGVEKNQYVTCGGMFKRDDGSFSIKMDSIPLGDWNGWLGVYDLDEDRQQNYNKGTEAAREAMAPAGGAVQPGMDDFSDDIPFAPFMTGSIV